MARSLFLIVFGLVWMAGTVLLGWQMGKGVYRQTLTKDFAQAQGVILESKAEERIGNNSQRLRPVVKYEYKVDGNRHQGSRVRFGMNSGSASAVHEEVRRYPTGKEVTVFYDPADPSVAVLDTALRGSDFVTLLFITPFACIGIATIAGGVSALARSMRKEAGGVQIIPGVAGRTQVRLPEMHPISYALLTTGLLSFICIFIVGFAAGKSNSITIPLFVWLGCIVAGAVVFLREFSRLQLGYYDLVLDSGSAMISLPRIYGLKTPKAAGFRDVREIRVKEIVTRGKKRVSRSYDVVMRLVDGFEQKLSNHSHQPSAAAFATWLREKLGMAPE